MSAPIDLRELQARFDEEAEQIEVDAEAEERTRQLVALAHRAERIATPLLLGTCAMLGLVCLASQILRVIA